MVTITEDYVSFETAKLLKEKGFPITSINFKDLVFCMYDENGGIQWGCYHPDWYARVTLQMAMKWLREVHKIDIWVEGWNRRYKGNFHSEQRGVEALFYEYSYEETVETSIKYSLENLI